MTTVLSSSELAKAYSAFLTESQHLHTNALRDAFYAGVQVAEEVLADSSEYYGKHEQRT